MLRTLRRRLILSHVVPLLVILPLAGVTLIYILETRVVFPSLLRELRGEAALLAEVAADDPAIWSDPARMRVFVERADRGLDVRVMLLRPDGELLASTDPVDAPRLGQVLSLPEMSRVRAGEMTARAARSRDLNAEVADVLAPVRGPDGRAIGVVRLSLLLISIPAEFRQWRYVGGGVVLVGALLGVAVGWALALNLQRPLARLTQAVHEFSGRRRWEPLPEQEPEELALLVRAFNGLVDRLRSLEEARRQLLANLVHELGRPLGALRSGIQALEGGAAEDPALRHELLAGMDDEFVRLRRLLDDLAGLHDQVLGTLELQRRSVETAQWLAHVLAPWREAARAKDLRWDAPVPADLPNLMIDPDRMAQALGNLLSNAITYTPAGGAVSVAAGAQEKSLWIRVSDSGPGISPEEQQRIFDPFYRGRSSRRFPRGMGLGLTIARDLVAAHGGRLELDSSPGHGSSFTVWLSLHTP